MTFVGPPDHGPGWEYLYLASEIARGLADHDPEYRDYLSGVVQPSGEVLNDLPKQLSDLSREVIEIVASMDLFFSPEALEKALGPPGQPGDEEAIRGIAKGLSDMYAALIAWAQSIRGATVSGEWHPACSALVRMVAAPIGEIREFSALTSETVGQLVADLRNGKSPSSSTTLTLKLNVPDSYISEFEQALGDVQRLVTGASDKGQESVL